jgi:hypothetical protein
MKKFNVMEFISQNSIVIVPLFPMAVVGVAAYYFAIGAGLHWALALALAGVAALAIELAGISSFRTLTGVYQSFKQHHHDGFVVAEFALLVVGVAVYIVAIVLASLVLERQFAGSWPLGAMAGLMAVAVYIVRAVGESYTVIEQEVEQDKEFERFRREQLFEQELKDREHARRMESKQETVHAYETRIDLEQAKKGQLNRSPTASNRGKQGLRPPAATSPAFKSAFEAQPERNRANREQRKEQLLNVLSEQPEIGQNEAGRRVGIAASTASDYVRELTESGRLGKNGSGWKVR